MKLAKEKEKIKRPNGSFLSSTIPGQSNEKHSTYLQRAPGVREQTSKDCITIK